MKRLYLDANVVLDVLLARPPFAGAAQNLLLLGQAGKATLLVSSLTFTTAHYILSKAIGKVAAMQALATLAAHVTVAAVDELVIRQAIQAGQRDFEDTVQLFAALAAKADAIVTRDPKGFQASPIAVFDPQAALVAIS